jgi:hypothetical protein
MQNLALVKDEFFGARLFLHNFFRKLSKNLQKKLKIFGFDKSYSSFNETNFVSKKIKKKF